MHPKPWTLLAVGMGSILAGCCSVLPPAIDHFDERAPQVTVRGFLYAVEIEDADYPKLVARPTTSSSENPIDDWIALAGQAEFEHAREVQWLELEADHGVVAVPAGDAVLSFEVEAERYFFDDATQEWRRIDSGSMAGLDRLDPSYFETAWVITSVDRIEDSTVTEHLAELRRRQSANRP